MKIIKHYLNGQDYDGGDRTSDIFNPATGEVISKVQLGNKKVVNETIDISLKALENWTKTTPAKRASIMFNYKIISVTQSNLFFINHVDMVVHSKIASDGCTLTNNQCVRKCC